MSEIFKSVEKLLNDNGVRVDVEELQLNHPDDDMRCVRIEKKILTLDFSEHDKVFEDKIELLNRNLNLQKDKRCEVEIERNYLAERINQLKSKIASLESHMSRLRERCMDGARRNFDRGNYGCLTILNRNGDLEAENEKLKQRIAELESKETKSFDEVPDNITIDGYKCKIIKTESGLYISRDEIYSIIEKEKEPLKQKCKELEDKHQSDCIEINRLNAAIDVLIHKVEYLRRSEELE